MRNRFPLKNPLKSSIKLRATCRIHSPLGTGALPAISTRLVDRSMTKNTRYRTKPTRVHTSTVKKSAAAIASQCAFRNFDQGMCGSRSGAGPMPCSLNIRLTVDRETRCPIFDSSPTIRV
jgi:hypothetical protein